MESSVRGVTSRGHFRLIRVAEIPPRLSYQTYDETGTGQRSDIRQERPINPALAHLGFSFFLLVFLCQNRLRIVHYPRPFG